MDEFTKEIEAIAETGIKGNALRQAYEKELQGDHRLGLPADPGSR